MGQVRRVELAARHEGHDHREPARRREDQTAPLVDRHARPVQSADVTGEVDRPLSDGQYVICLRDPTRGAALAASGIHVDTDIDRWADYFGHMLKLRMQRSSCAQPSLHSEDRPSPVFSIITTVYNTDPLYLDELAGMVRSQTFGDFEWLLLDNGSERKETIDAVDKAP